MPDLVDALIIQERAPPFEIILVDNTPDEARPTLTLPPCASILPCAAPGAYAARNAGIAVARAPLLAFTDADCRPAPGWLAAIAAAASQEAEALLAGPVEITASPSPNRYEIYDLVRGVPQALYVRHGYAATANLVVPMSVMAQLGGFDAERYSGGDAELCRRAGEAGYSLRFIAEAPVIHPARASWHALATKARRIKGGQITRGTSWDRALWILRSLTPPLRATVRFLRTASRSWPERVAAIQVLYRLWLVEIDEVARILAGKPPERT